MKFDLWTFGLQVINFLILAWLLQKFLYQPARKVMKDRRERLNSKLRETEEAKNAAEEERGRLKEANAAFAADKAKRLAELDREIIEDKQKALEEARIKAKEIVDRGRAQIEAEKDEAMASLRIKIAELASDMAGKIISEHAGGAATALGRFHQYASALSDEDLRTLRRDVDGAGVRVIAAAPVEQEEREKWKTEITEAVGVDCEIAFDVDPALIDGVRLQFPHAAIDLSAAGALAKLKNSVASP